MVSHLVIITSLLTLHSPCLSFNPTSSRYLSHGATASSSSSLQFQRTNHIEQINKKSDIYSANVGKKVIADTPLAELSSSSLTQTLMKKFSVEEMDDGNRKWFARSILIVVSAFYGTNFGCVKILGEALDPSVAAVLRFSLAALVFLPSLLKVIKSKPQLVRGGLEIGAYNALGYYTQASALVTTEASTVAFICSLAVIVVPILDTLFPKKSRSSKNEAWYAPLLPALVATAGVGCLELGGDKIPGFGDLLALGQPLFFGLGFWRIESFMRENREPGDAQAFTGAMMVSVATFALIWSIHDFILPQIGNPLALLDSIHTQTIAFSDWKVVAAIAWTGIVTTALTAYGENFAMKYLSASESTVIYSTEPLWGTAFAVAGAFSSVQIAVGESMAEVLENVSANWATVLERLSETRGEV